MKSGWIALSLVLGIVSAGAAQAATISSRPILFIHGFNPFGLGENCKSDWSKMETTLASQGFTGQMVTVGYYENDSNCDVLTSPKGTIMTHISDLSHDFAWYVYDQFSSKNVAVDVAAHSMGGLILRYALYRVAVSDPDFPPYLMISHAATMATPFTGYSSLAELCHLIAINLQCDDMFPLSSFIEGLKAPAALVPQGPDGTLWSGVGSNADFIDDSDGFVNSASATSMEIPDTAKVVLPWYMLVFHTNYTDNKTVIADVAQSLSLTAYPEVSVAKLAQAKLADRAVASIDDVSKADAVVSRAEVAQDFSQTPTAELPGVITPYYENGVSLGVQFTQILSGGLFDEMGIQDGDIVQGCTQATINEPFQAMSVLEISTQPILLSFCIVRNGTTLPKTIIVQ